MRLRAAAIAMVLLLAFQSSGAAVCMTACDAVPAAHHPDSMPGMADGGMEHHALASSCCSKSAQAATAICPNSAVDAALKSVADSRTVGSSVTLNTSAGTLPSTDLADHSARQPLSWSAPDTAPQRSTVLRI